MDRLRDIRRLRRWVRVGAPDPSLTPVSGMAAVSELVDRLGMVRRLDAAIGPIKARDRGFTGGQLLVGMAGAQLAGEDFLVGLDRRRADVAGQVLAPVSGLSSTTAAGLARRFTDGQWNAVETGIGPEPLHQSGQIPELSIPIRVIIALGGLASRLQAVPHGGEQPRHHRMTDGQFPVRSTRRPGCESI